jgi:hypothetical protein
VGTKQGCQIQILEIRSSFVKNQELIRKLFLKNQEKNQEVFSMKRRQSGDLFKKSGGTSEGFLKSG